ncbi:MAG: magnesium-translocating P-type ATPase, partial [Nitrospiraceae bacterium]
WQERGAAGAVEALLKSVLIHATALRDGSPREVPIDEIVPGDVILLRAGDTLPGDCLLLKAKDLFVDEAALTGETYPVEKQVGILPPDTPLASRTNALFMGTHVISGTAEAMVARTGRRTVFGHVSERLWRRRPETEFERGIRRFGSLLLEVTLVLALAIFAINVHLQRPALDSLLFALALAVGLTPQLLPAIISINLAHGAKRMARRKVIVKRPVSIENFGSMNVLCSDKTGTLTEGMVRVRSALDVDEKESGKVLLCAYLNASFETGFVNPIDEAIRKHRAFDISGFHKLDEEPYDFVRKRLSILVVHHDQRLMVTKGALPSVMEVCSSAELSSGALVEIGAVRTRIMRRADELSGQGFRVIGVAYREIEAASKITKDHETGMVFLGVLVLYDPPKPGVAETLSELARLGVSLKIITGDNRLV